ncbi:hypothetical protein PPYR_01864 [Photinus pyralis]|uniref:DDE-1 domain-containing protein n=1 Tax=Photinus pyralis TaxID=7054 RepID=A0A5N4B5R7_PHOPY|nr:hypothetical protein PPYR_01864 [Photinus pyralis]
MSRNSHLSLRAPEPTSLSRATAFNKRNVSKFYNNLRSVYEKNNLGPESIFNVDETGVTTAHKPQKIICRKVFGPFKHFYNEHADVWMVNNPGQTISFRNIPELVGHAYSRAFIPSNVTKGFSATGIYPYNPHVFADSNFSCAEVTNRPLNEVSAQTIANTTHQKMRVLTDTPEKLAIEEEFKKRKNKQSGKKKVDSAKRNVFSESQNVLQSKTQELRKSKRKVLSKTYVSEKGSDSENEIEMEEIC